MTIKNPIIILLIATLLYLPTITFDFAYDDLLLIVYSPLVTTAEPGWSHLIQILASPTAPGDLYRPIATLSYWMTFLATGLNPAPYHAINILLYSALCIAVYSLYLMIFKRRDIAFVAALLFTLHPIHVEPVANVIGRAELCSALFGILGLLALYRATCSASKVPWSILSALSLFIALLSKESAYVFMPIYAYAIVLWMREAHRPLSGTTPIRILIPHLIICVVAISMRLSALSGKLLISPDSTAINPENPLLGMSFIERLIPALHILGDYLLNICAPISLSADYSQLRELLMASTYSLAGAISLVLLLSYLIATKASRDAATKFFGIWFFLAFALTANIITPIGTIMGDRLALVPSIGAIAFLTSVFANGKFASPRILVVAICLFYFSTSFRQVGYWKNNGTLFAAALAHNPENPKALYNYGLYTMTVIGDTKAAKALFHRVLLLVPDHLYSMKNLADIALREGDVASVITWYRRILAQYPEEEQVKKQLAEIERRVQ